MKVDAKNHRQTRAGSPFRTARWLACLMGVVGIVPPVAADEAEVSLHRYLELSLEHHLTRKRHLASRPAEQLSLEQGERLYWPDVTVHSSYEEATTEKERTSLAPANRTIKSGVTSGVDTDWRSPLGTQITLGLEHQYGRQLGMKTQGIPEENLTVQNLSLEVSQPLLKDNTPSYNSLERQRAQANWRRYLAESDRTRLDVQRAAMKAFVDLQQQWDRLRFHREQLRLNRYLEDVTRVLIEEKRSLPLEGEMVALDVARQNARVEHELTLYRQHVTLLTLDWVRATDHRVGVYPTMGALIDTLQPAALKGGSITAHPDYRDQRLQEDLARLQVTQTNKDRWPDLDVFYRYDKHFREALPDEESNTWGVRLSYAVFDLPTRERQARARADLSIERWDTQDTRKRLEWERRRLKEAHRSLMRELELSERRITLSRQALAQEQARYQAGRASYRDVQQRQQDLLDWQLDRLNTQAEVASNLVEQTYHHQLDWLAIIPAGAEPHRDTTRSDT